MTPSLPYQIPKINWADPDYSEVLRARVARYAKLKAEVEKSPTLLPALKAYYADNPVQFILDWGCTYDPRRVNLGEDPIMPFILFPRQAEFVTWAFRMWREGKRGLGEKSRDVGFTWLVAAIAYHIFNFHPQAAIGFGSRKEDLVDRAGDPDSIFWKLRKYIELLPPEFKPAEFADPASFKRHSQHMLIVNPENGSTIKGEAGDEIGRGGRTSIYFVDEAAFLARPLLAEASLSATTNCRIDISTVNGTGTPFYDNRNKLPHDQVFVFDWTDDPRKRTDPSIPETEEPWYKAKQAELDATVFASEVLRDAGAAIANTYIPAQIVIDAERYPLDRIIQPLDVPWRVGVDAARMGNDESVIHFRQGRINRPQERFRKLDGHELAGRVIESCERLIRTAPVELIAIELDGPGASAYDVLKRDRTFGKVVVGVHTGKRLKDGRNLNLRAWLNRQAKEYLELGECHLPRDEIFRAQATSFLHTYNGGRLQIESKDDYRARFARGKTKAEKMAGPSPDRWDAFVLTFVRPRSRPVAELRNEIFLPNDPAFGY